MSTLRQGRFEIRSDKDLHFTLGLATDVSEDENLQWCPRGDLAKGVVTEIEVISDENLAWEVQFYGRDTFATTNADTNPFLGKYEFSAAQGKRNDGAGFYYYHQRGLSIPIRDLDLSGEAHVKLVNRSAAAKTAGAAGEAVVIVRGERY